MKALTVLDRYIGRSVFYSTMLVLTVLALLLAFISFVDGLSDLGKGDYGVGDLLRYVVLSLPQRIYALFPTAALLGAVVGLSFQAAGSELVAMRAAGVSLLRIAVAVMKVGMVFVLAGVLIGEFVVPSTEDLAQRGRAEAMHRTLRVNHTGLWLRNGGEFVNIGEVLPDRSLLGVNVYRFNGERALTAQLHAERALHEGRAWVLRDVATTTLGDGRIKAERRPALAWDVALNPDDVAMFTVRPDGLSMLHLLRYVEHLRANKQDTARYELALWNKLLLPLSTAVMILLAIPFVFSSQRSGGIGQKVFAGVMLGLVFNMLDLSFGYVSLLYGLAPLAGAAAPTLLFLGLTAWLFHRAA